jgi:transposase
MAWIGNVELLLVAACPASEGLENRPRINAFIDKFSIACQQSQEPSLFGVLRSSAFELSASPLIDVVRRPSLLFGIGLRPSQHVGVDGLRTASMCQNEVVKDLKRRRPSVEQIIRIGMDTSKHVFQLHGVNVAEEPILRKKLRRREMVAFFEKAPPTVIAIEACGGSHHWARLLQSFGHEVKLLPPQFVKPYVKRGKNDAADAEALCEAMSRPTMRFVPVKTADSQAALMLVGVRDRLIRNRTQLANAIRGYAAEFGMTAAKGMCQIGSLLERIAADETLPDLARELFAFHAEEYAQLQAQLKDVDIKLMAWHRADECSRRLAQIPGVGPIGASLLVMKTPAPETFRSARHFAAWLGLTPKDHSTAGKVRLGVITRAGDEALRSVLVVGATAVIQHVRRGRGAAWPWLGGLLKRRPPKLVAVALANKIARIAWKMMVSGETYRAKPMPPALSRAA